jgi:hypothetical protein
MKLIRIILDMPDQDRIFNSRRDGDDRTALHWAVLQGHRKMTFEIASKCDSIINAKDRFDRAALFYAVEHQQFPDLLVRMLLLLGAEVDLIDVDWKTPLRLAIEKEDSLLTRRLAEFDSVMMHMMIEECNWIYGPGEHTLLMLDFLFTHASKDQLIIRNRKGQSILHASASTGNMAVVRLLIKHDIVRPREIMIEVDKAGDTPLISVARIGWLEMAKFLVEDCCFNRKFMAALIQKQFHYRPAIIKICCCGFNDFPCYRKFMTALIQKQFHYLRIPVSRRLLEDLLCDRKFMATFLQK